jgi:hypothetical protein
MSIAVTCRCNTGGLQITSKHDQQARRPDLAYLGRLTQIDGIAEQPPGSDWHDHRCQTAFGVVDHEQGDTSDDRDRQFMPPTNIENVIQEPEQGSDQERQDGRQEKGELLMRKRTSPYSLFHTERFKVPILGRTLDPPAVERVFKVFRKGKRDEHDHQADIPCRAWQTHAFRDDGPVNALEEV